MMTSQLRVSDPSLSRQLILAAGIIVGSLLLMGAIGFWAARTIDGQSLATETELAGNGLVEQFERIAKEQDGSLIWDDSVLAVRTRDREFMAENLVEWIGEFFEHERVYILAPDDSEIAAAHFGETASPEAFEQDASSIGPLVGAIRTSMAEASAGLGESTRAITGLGASDFIELADGTVAIVSVRPIVPETGAVVQAPGTEYLHVSVDLLDTKLVSEIGEHFAIDRLEFVPANGPVDRAAVFPVIDRLGETRGWLTWQATDPASALIEKVGPALAFFVLVAFAGFGFVVIRLRGSSADLRLSEARARYLAMHDSLTDIPNRALFEDRLDKAIASIGRGSDGVALHYIDLDRFKTVNDSLGHPAGDELVRQVAKRLTDLVRAADTVARIGGDEFAIVQVGVGNEQDAELLGTKVVTLCEKPFDISGEEVRITASVGAVLARSASTTPEELMRKADIALYEGKSEGGDRYRLFAGDMDDVLKQRRSVEKELGSAIQTGEGLRLEYQPVFDGLTGELLGAEALIRWSHPAHHDLSPSTFIAIAEERGLIERLGRWVLKNACTFAVGSELPWIAVNISPIQVQIDGFAERTMALLSDVGLAPRRLQLEITEGVLLHKSTLVRSALAKLRNAGVRIVLDDFGTGYSSINYLRSYGIDKLKIDRSFVSQLGAEKEVDSIVSAIIQLAGAMGMSVTAEGVETEAQRSILVDLGCAELQGFLLSRPISGDRLHSMLNRKPRQAELAGRSRGHR